MPAYHSSTPREPAVEAHLLLRDALLPALRVACLNIELHGHAVGEPLDGLVLLAEHMLECLRMGLA